MAIKNSKGEWLDHRGFWVSPKYIDKRIRERDRMVTRITDFALKVEAWITKLSDMLWSLVEAYMASIGGTVEHGNYSYIDYAQTRRIIVKNDDTIAFDETRTVVEKMVREVMHELGASADPRLMTLVDKSYLKTDRGTKINRAALEDLMSTHIDHPTWNEAQRLHAKSRQVVDKKRYCYMEIKADKGKWRRINLNFSRQ